MTSYLGIDIAQDTFDICLQREGYDPEAATFANNRKGFQKLQRFLKRRKLTDLHACMEATGVYYEDLAHFLHDKGYAVSVVNPLQIKAYAQSQLRRNKTDALDAAIIADFCCTQQSNLWTPPPPAYYELRTLVRHLAALGDDRQRQRNRLHARKHAAQPVATVIENLQAHIAFLDQQIEQVKRQIQDHIDQHPELKKHRDLLASIQGIGDLTAAKLLAEYGDMTQFSNVREVVAFAGLNPKHKRSGTSVRGKTKISKIGRSSIRAALYMPAISAKQHNRLLQPFIQRLEARGLCNMAILVALMRKLLHLAFGILKSGQPFDPHYLEQSAANA